MGAVLGVIRQVRHLMIQSVSGKGSRGMELLQGGLKLRQLQVFREVLRTGSTRRAAAAVGISQPAVSQYVKQLEAVLGFALFKRSANRILPLQEAWELLRNVELALTSLDRLEASIDPQFASHQMNFNALRFAGVEPDIVVEYDSNGHEAGFVSAGLGVSITNEIVAREYKAFELGIKPVEPSALYHYVAVWQKGRTFSNALNVTLEAVVSLFAPDDVGGTMGCCAPPPH